MPPMLAWIAVNDRLPLLAGVRAFAGGPFEALGARGMAGAGVAFVAVSGLEVLVGRWLWRGERRGGAAGLLLFPATLTFAVGFDLPLWYAVVPIRTFLVTLGWLRIPAAGRASPAPSVSGSERAGS